MMRIIIFIISFLLKSLSGQHVHGIFPDQGMTGTTIFFIKQLDRKTTILDSAKVHADGSFSFQNRIYPKGFYSIRAKDHHQFELILDGEEKKIQLEFHDGPFNDVTVSGSVENELNIKYSLDLNSIYMKMKRNMYIIKNESMFEEDDIIEAQTSFHTLQSTLDSLFNILALSHSNSFFYEAMSIMAPHITMDKESFFDSDFMEDTTLIHTPVIKTKVGEYLSVFTTHDEYGFITSVNTIMDHAGATDEVYYYSLNVLLGLFHRRGPDYMFEYMVDEYIGDEYDLITDRGTRRKAQGLKALQKGSHAPNLTIKDISGRKRSLYEIYPDNELNLVFFWSSQCLHCVQTIPKLKDIYREYKKKGFEVIAISLDKKKYQWHKAVNDEKLQWINLSELKGWGSKSADAYFIPHTPYYYLVNDELEIKARPDNLRQMELYLKLFLNNDQ